MANQSHLTGACDVEDQAAALSKPNALQILCRIRGTTREVPSSSEAQVGGQPSSSDEVERLSDRVVALRRASSFIEQQYSFEHVFGPDAPQADVFARTAAPLVESLLADHRDALLLAYGATGSGKTFTVAGVPQEPGIIARTLDHLFGALRAGQSGSRLNTDFSIGPDSQNSYVLNTRADHDSASGPLSVDRRLHLSANDLRR